jgi:hypothetical protein
VLNLKVPNVGNFDLYSNSYIRLHMTSIGILSELRSEEIFRGIFFLYT